MDVRDSDKSKSLKGDYIMKTRKIVAALLATAMVISGVVIAPKNVEASTASSVIFESRNDCATYLGKSAPEFAFNADNMYTSVDKAEKVDAVDEKGYVFGGWYDANEEPLLKDTQVTGEVFAKWVPASVMSIKAQNHSSVGEASEDASIRVITSVDSLYYQKVGFTIEINNNGKPLEGAAEGTANAYTKLLANKKEYSAKDIFGADSSHFVVWKLTDIPQKGFDDIIYVRPYWVTTDGVRVEGLGKYIHVEDGYKGYVSVPVNLNMLSKEEVAAGVIEVSYPDGFTLVEDKVEIGRVFDEMEFANKGNSVKFAANVADIAENAEANDIFVNLRFTKDGGAAHASNIFEILSTDFCDNEENQKTINIWDILY